MKPSGNRRKRKVIDPQLQFGLMLYAFLAGGVAVLVHGVLVSRAMAKNPKERFADASEMARALKALKALQRSGGRRRSPTVRGAGSADPGHVP